MSEVSIEKVESLLNVLSANNVKIMHTYKQLKPWKCTKEDRINELVHQKWNEEDLAKLKRVLIDQIAASKHRTSRIYKMGNGATLESAMEKIKGQEAEFAEDKTLFKEGFSSINVEDKIISFRYWYNAERSVIIDGPEGIDVVSTVLPIPIKAKVDFNKKLAYIEEDEFTKTLKGKKVVESTGILLESAGLCDKSQKDANAKVRTFIGELLTIVSSDEHDGQHSIDKTN